MLFNIACKLHFTPTFEFLTWYPSTGELFKVLNTVVLEVGFLPLSGLFLNNSWKRFISGDPRITKLRLLSVHMHTNQTRQLTSAIRHKPAGLSNRNRKFRCPTVTRKDCPPTWQRPVSAVIVSWKTTVLLPDNKLDKQKLDSKQGFYFSR